MNNEWCQRVINPCSVQPEAFAFLTNLFVVCGSVLTATTGLSALLMACDLPCKDKKLSSPCKLQICSAMRIGPRAE